MQRALSIAHRTAFGVVDARLLGDRPPRGCATYTLRQPRLYRPAAGATRPRGIEPLYPAPANVAPFAADTAPTSGTRCTDGGQSAAGE